MNLKKAIVVNVLRLGVSFFFFFFALSRTPHSLESSRSNETNVAHLTLNVSRLVCPEVNYSIHLKIRLENFDIYELGIHTEICISSHRISIENIDI